MPTPFEIVSVSNDGQFEQAARLAAYEVLEQKEFTDDDAAVMKELLAPEDIAVALQGGEVMGMIAYTLGCVDKAVKIEALATRPENRGQGVGRVLLKYVEDIAISEGKQQIVLKSLPGATSFYEKLGYRQTGGAKLTYKKDLISRRSVVAK